MAIDYQAREKLIEKYLKAGHPPASQWTRASGRKSAEAMAAAEFGTSRQTLSGLIRDGRINPDWSLYKQPTPGGTPVDVLPDVSGDEHERLQLRYRRAETDIQQLRREVKSARDQLIEMQDMRDWVEGLSREVRKPALLPYKEGAQGATGHTAKVFISDVHAGEMVNPAQLGGLNAYNKDICQRRLERLARKVVFLLNNYSNVKLDKLVVTLGGDLISGGIHEELAKTDDMTAAESVLFVSGVLADVIATWSKKLKLPIDVYCVPGNHGRTTRKNETKDMVANSYDTLVCQFVEKSLQGIGDITFYYPESGEAVYSIYRWTILDLHGHTTGARGGGGVYGPAYAMVRGAHKTRMNYQSRGIIFHEMFQGHLHTTLRVMPYHHANGSVIGPNEFSMNFLKAEPEPASQSMWIFHPDNRIVDEKTIYLGKPDEGTIYQPGYRGVGV